MSRINELIQKLCPDGVEYKPIGAVISAIRTGLNPRQNFKLNSRDAKYQYITVRELNSFSLKVTDKTDRVDSTGLSKIQTRSKIQIDDILFSGTGTIGRTALVTTLPKTWNVKEGIYVLTPIASLINSRFFIYLIHSIEINKQIQSKSDGSTVASISMASLQKVLIPIPPLEIQIEIVNILDKFTFLEAELEAELKARKTQYEHYRNALLSFEGKKVEWKTLGEIAFYPKDRVSSDFITASNYIGVDNLLQNRQGKTSSSFVPKSGKLIEFNRNDILIGNIRPYLKKIWMADSSGGTNGDVVIIRIRNEYSGLVDSRYLYYILSSDAFFDYNMKYAKGAKMPRGDKGSILKYKIPLPSFYQQEKIVSILDKFDALVNDISVGLPAEIEARRKQFEYYRNKLLTFKHQSYGQV